MMASLNRGLHFGGLAGRAAGAMDIPDVELDLDLLDTGDDADETGGGAPEGANRAVAEAGEAVAVRRAFDKYDADGSGAVDAAELEALAADLDAPLAGDELQEALRALDEDGSGRVERDEFVDWWLGRGKGIGGGVGGKLARLAKRGRKRNYTDVHVAAWKGDVDALKSFVEIDPELAKARDTTEFGEGSTPLHYAAYNGHKEACQLLLDEGANVDDQNDSGCTPMFYAAQQGHEAVIGLLLDFAADTSIAESSKGFCAIDVAATPSIVADLLDAGDYTKPSELIAPSCRVLRSGMALVEWEPPEKLLGDVALPVLSYRMVVRQVGDPDGKIAEEDAAEGIFTGEIVTTPDITSAHVQGLKVGGVYQFSVAAKNAIGEGTMSALSDALTFVRTPSRPRPPVIVNQTTTSVEIGWVAPNDRGSEIKSYHLYRRDVEDGKAEPVELGRFEAGVTGTVLQQGALPKKPTTFEVVVIAKNAVGSSRPSPALEVKPLKVVDDDPFGVKAARATRRSTTSAGTRKSSKPKPRTRKSASESKGKEAPRPRLRKRKGLTKAQGGASSNRGPTAVAPVEARADDNEIAAWSAGDDLRASVQDVVPTPGITAAASESFAENVLASNEERAGDALTAEGETASESGVSSDGW